MRTFRLLLALVLLSNIAIAQDIEQDAGLEPAAAGFNAPYQAREVLRFSFSDRVLAATNNNVLVELDGIDITATLTPSDGHYEFTPPQPLSAGEHLITAMAYYSNGDVRELGRWNIQVAPQRLRDMLSARGNIQLQSNHRIAEGNLQEPLPDTSQGQGGAQFEVTVQGENKQLTASSDWIYTSKQQFNPTDRELDIGDWRVAAKLGRLDVTLGHHQIDHNGLVMQYFQRRGISTAVNIPEAKLKFKLFNFSTNDISGLQKGIGLSESSLHGFGIDFQPFDGDTPLKIGVIYVSGDGLDNGFAIGSDRGAVKGRAIGVTADLAAFDQRLSWRANMARSRFDFDDSGVFEPAGDRAWSSTLEWRGHANSKGRSWSSQFEAGEVGTFFRSLSNPGLAFDRQWQKLYVERSGQRGRVYGQWQHERDNIAKISIYPTIDSQQWTGGAEWSKPGDNVSHYLRATTIWLQNDLVSAGAGSSYDPSQTQRSVELGWTQQRLKSSLDTSLLFIRIDNDEPLAQDTISHGLTLNYRRQFGERLSIAPLIQWQHSIDQATDESTINRGYGLNLDATLIKHKLELRLGLNRNLTQSPNGLFNSASDQFNSELIWHWITAKSNRPGFDIRLQGQWQKQEFGGIPTPEVYQVFLTISSTLPLEWTP